MIDGIQDCKLVVMAKYFWAGKINIFLRFKRNKYKHKERKSTSKNGEEKNKIVYDLDYSKNIAIFY